MQNAKLDHNFGCAPRHIWKNVWRERQWNCMTLLSDSGKRPYKSHWQLCGSCVLVFPPPLQLRWEGSCFRNRRLLLFSFFGLLLFLQESHRLKHARHDHLCLEARCALLRAGRVSRGVPEGEFCRMILAKNYSMGGPQYTFIHRPPQLLRQVRCGTGTCDAPSGLGRVFDSASVRARVRLSCSNVRLSWSNVRLSWSNEDNTLGFKLSHVPRV